MPLTPLIGRDDEVALAVAMLKRESVRLLTLSGPGGIGKTRLAIQIATELEGWFDSGIAFVALASVPNADLVISTIARVLKIGEAADAAIIDTLSEALHDRELLLVIDNFEHVLAAAPLLTELLTACPHLKILVTSRSLLRLSGEQAIPIPPFDLPRLDRAAPLSELSRCAAVELFVSRASAVNPGFQLDEENAQLVAEICLRVDGLPLGLELAAAQIGVLPLTSLLARLRDRLPLPLSGPRDLPARLRTVHDAITWSYDLLGPEEQRLFRRCGVFAGGFNLDAAEALGEAPEVLGTLATLVESSLVRQHPWEGEPRFSMLEPIRDFALEVLERSGESETVRSMHAEWCLSLAEASGLATFRPVPTREMRRLNLETANFRAALDWLYRHQDNDRMVRLAAALGRFWTEHGYSSEGRIWLERALAVANTGVPRARALAMVQLSRSIFFMGNIPRAEFLLADAEAFYDQRNDFSALVEVLVMQAAIACRRHDLDRAKAVIARALASAEQITDDEIAPVATARALANMGMVAHVGGDLAAARGHHERAMRLRLDHNDTIGAIRSLCDLGDICRDMADYAAAMAFYRECLTLLLDQGGSDTRVIRDALCGAALAAAEWRHPETAGRLLGAARALADEVGWVFLMPDEQHASHRAATRTRAALGEAGYQRALAAGQELDLTAAIAEVYALSPDGGRPAVIGVRLTPRQRDVLRLLAEQRSDREIADLLFISVRTAEGHVAGLMQKLEVESRAAAVAAAIAAGLIEAPQTYATGYAR